MFRSTKGPSSWNQTTVIQHKTKLVTSVCSWIGVKESNVTLTISFTPLLLCTDVTNLVLCCIALVLFPDDGPLRAETCRSKL